MGVLKPRPDVATGTPGLMNQTAAGSVVFPTDFRNDVQTQTRFVQVLVVNAADSIQVSGSIDNITFVPIGAALTAPGQVTWTIPWPFIQVTKTGTTGLATVQGVL
jgi:hypothetical protein